MEVNFILLVTLLQIFLEILELVVLMLISMIMIVYEYLNFVVLKQVRLQIECKHLNFYDKSQGSLFKWN